MSVTPQLLREVMEIPQNVRNISVVAHVDHGKTTLTDSLLAKAGLIDPAKAGSETEMDKGLEQERGITINSTSVSMYFDLPPDTVNEVAAAAAAATGGGDDSGDGDGDDSPAPPLPLGGTGLLVNLIDSPGHVDFSSEVTAALRVTDGALVVVDCVEGVSVQTETVLRQALAERVKPVLMLNKVDRLLGELQLDPDAVYAKFSRVIEGVNAIIATYYDPAVGDWQVRPQDGTVAFGSGLYGWAFTLTDFARILAAKMGHSPTWWLRRLWGDHWFDRSSKRWVTTRPSDQAARGFVEFVLSPVFRLHHALRQQDGDQVVSLLGKLGITLVTRDIDWSVKKKAHRRVMQAFLPAADALVGMVARHLPSPLVAQQYRMELLYTGPHDDAVAAAIRSCDPKGPLVMYVSKMVPDLDGRRFYAFGRVFAGTMRTGASVSVLGPNYKPGQRGDRWVKSVPRIALMMGHKFESVGDVPSGATCGLVGIDSVLSKAGTVLDASAPMDAPPLRNMRFSVSPVVQVAVAPVQARDHSRFIKEIGRLARVDPMVRPQVDHRTGQVVIAGAGELHLEVVLHRLEHELLKGDVPLRREEPIVTFHETVTQPSDRICLAKSTNKLNRLWITAEPLDPALVTAMETGAITERQDSKERAKTLVSEYGWDAADARRIWAFGPEARPSNLLVDMSKAVAHLNEARDTIIAAFRAQMLAGPLAGEEVRGVRFNLVDAQLHADAVHRSAAQLTPAVDRVMKAAMLSAGPCFLEPVYQVDVKVAQAAAGGVYSELARKRGQVIAEEVVANTPMVVVSAHLPVLESFGFDASLRGSTSGKAFPQMSFSHWDVLPGDMTEASSLMMAVLKKIRERRGMKAELPTVEMFNDRL